MWRRRVLGALCAVALLTLIVCDLALGGFRIWWDRHSLSGSVLSSLLVLGVAGLIVDEVVARRQRRDRSSSIAVQAVILYGQARRAHQALMASDGDPDFGSGEVRTLASMILTASPSLFDDPAARLFLEEVQRLAGEIFKALREAAGGAPSAAGLELMTAQMNQVHMSAAPLIARLPAEYRTNVDVPAADA